MSPSSLEEMARRIAASALPLNPNVYGPWKGSMRSVSADQVPPEFATTGTDFLYQPRDSTWKRRDGQLIKFDSATGLLPAHWSAKARHGGEYRNDQMTDGLPSSACLFTKETIASGLDDGRFSNFWWRDQINGANRTIGDDYSTTTTYPAPGNIQAYRVIPLWYESGDGGITRGAGNSATTQEFSRRFFFSGSRRWLKAGGWIYHPSRLGTPSRQKYAFSATSSSVLTAFSDLDPQAGPPTYVGWAPNFDHYYSTIGGAQTAGTHALAFSSDDGASSFLAINEGAPNGSNPEKIGLSGTVLPGYTYTISCKVFTLSGTLPGGSNMIVSLVDSAGNEWLSASVSVSGIGTTPTATPFTVTTSGTPNSTGNTPNAIWLASSGAGATYVAVSYFTVTGTSTSGQPNYLIPSGPFPPTHSGSFIVGDRINTDQKSPNSDVSADAGWATAPTGGGTRFSQLDDIPSNDSDYVYRAGVGSEIKEFVVGMASFSVTPVSGDIVRTVVRAKITTGGGTGVNTIRIQFLSGAGGTTRAGADFVMTTNSSVIETFTLTLTDAEVQAIITAGEWATLRVRVVIFSNTAVANISAVYNIINEKTPLAATVGGGWRGKDRYMMSVAGRWEDGSVWALTTPRFPNLTLTNGLGLVTVDTNNPEQAYSFMRYRNIPILPNGFTDVVLLRTEKIDSTTEDVLTINPFRMGVIAEIPNGTTTYDDYFSDDDSLSFDPSGLVIRYDHMMPPRARYNFGGAQRVCHMNGSTNPCAITLAPVGLAADYDRNLADTDSTAYGSGSQYFYIDNNAGTEALVLVKKTSGAVVTSLSLAFATYTKLQDLVDAINATVFSGNGGQWRAQLCPDVSGDTPTALNLAAHKRTITSCVVSGQTITKSAGGLGKVAVGARVSGTGVTAGAYISRIDSDTQLTFVGTITAATKDLVYFFDTGDDVDTTLPWAQRVIANSLPGFAYFSMTFLNTETIKKATTWMTTASPGSTKAAPNCFSALADNEHTPPIDAGIGMGGGAVDNGFVVAFNNKRGAIRVAGHDNIGAGNDSDFHLYITNEGSGCSAWNTVAQGDRVVFLMANEGIYACDLESERLISKRIHCHDPATGDFTFENPLGLLASGGDTDGSYASARVSRGALWVCYRASGSTPNRVVVYPFTSGQETNGLRHMVRADGEPFGWSIPLVYGTSPVLVFSQSPRSSSEGLHLYGMSDGNAGSTGDGRIDELETGNDDNGTAIGSTTSEGAASVEIPWLHSRPGHMISGQDLELEHSSPAGSTGFLKFQRSNTYSTSPDSYSLTPSTGSTTLTFDPKLLPQGARVGARAVMLKYTQATGAARTLRKITLRTKDIRFFKT